MALDIVRMLPPRQVKEAVLRPKKNLVPPLTDPSWTTIWASSIEVIDDYRVQINPSSDYQNMNYTFDCVAGITLKTSFQTKKPRQTGSDFGIYMSVQFLDYRGVQFAFTDILNNTKPAVTTPAGTAKVRVWIGTYGTAGAPYELWNPQVEVATTATDFEPYIGLLLPTARPMLPAVR